jgi:hypothetical protein
MVSKGGKEHTWKKCTQKFHSSCYKLACCFEDVSYVKLAVYKNKFLMEHETEGLSSKEFLNMYSLGMII